MVYMDKPVYRTNRRYKKPVLCSHLVADTLEELHAFARQCGLRRWQFQTPSRHPHYDLKGRALERALVLLTDENIIGSKELVLKSHALLLRKKRVMNLIVVNKHTHTRTPHDFYIGRGSALGNPFTGSKELGKTKAQVQCQDRAEAVARYREYLREKILTKDAAICSALNAIYKRVKQGGPVYLVCYCKPQDCHGDVIKEIIEEKLLAAA